MGDRHEEPARQVAGLALGVRPAVAVLVADVLVGSAVADQGFEELSISVADAERAGRLPGPHRDPFDRLLIAQAQAHDLVVVSVDAAFDRYGVRRLW